MCLRLATISDYIHSYQGGEKCQTIGAAAGRTSEGKFKTSVTKEYPESLNRAIAHAINDTLASNQLGRLRSEPTQEQIDEATRNSTMRQQYDPYDPNTFQTIRDDYAKRQAAVVPAPGQDANHLRCSAHQLAESILKQGSDIASDDILQLLRQWPFSRNRKRTNVLPSGRTWVHSDTFGLVNDATTGNPVLTVLAQQFPAIARIIYKWASALCTWLPEGIPCTSLTINKGYAAAPHRDKGNAGPSVAVSLGHHTGGRLIIWQQDDGHSDIAAAAQAPSTCLDIAAKPHVFDGNQLHSVEPFVGERFSIIFFTCKAAISTKEPFNQFLSSCLGLTVPTRSQLQHLTQFAHKPSTVAEASNASIQIDKILAATTPQEVLQLNGSYSVSTARINYKNIARLVHPDKTADPRAVHAFRITHEAIQAIIIAASAAAQRSACCGPQHPLFTASAPVVRGATPRPQSTGTTDRHYASKPHHAAAAAATPAATPAAPKASSASAAPGAAAAPPPEVRQAGIINRGNTCYIAAVLHLVSAINFKDGLSNANTTQHPIGCAISRTLDKLHGQAAVIDIQDLWDAIGVSLPQFYNTEQQDAHEFLLAVLHSPLPEHALDVLSWSSSVRLSIPATGYHNTVHEHHTVMQIAIIQRRSTLEQCILDALKEEQLDGSESLMCPLTSTYETTYKSTFFARLPQQLLIQLKRFTSTGKNNAAVQIPRRLALQSSSQGVMHYSISAAVIHHGGLHNGHYTALVFNNSSNDIAYCDDSSIRTIPWATAENLLTQSYLLAYSQARP